MKIKSIIHSEAEFSKDRAKTHRYLLKKVWDNKKPMATIVMLNPRGETDALYLDKSVMLFMNFCIGAKYGGMFIVNLWSYRTQSEKELIRIAYSKRRDVNTDNWIRHAVNESEKLYIGWGSNKNRNKRINQFKELLNRCKKINIVRLNTEDDRMVHLSRSTVNKKERIITIDQI